MRRRRYGLGDRARGTPRVGFGIDPDLALALELADAADELTLDSFRATDLVVETKPDLTPVSDADRAVERTLRERLAVARPGDAVVGEELGPDGDTEGEAPGDGTRRWIVDPIDGTKSYVRGIPVFATLIALERDGELAVGVASAPALRRRWWAARGSGAFADGAPIRVSRVAALADAHLAYDSVRGFEECGLADRFLALARRCWRTRGFGDFWAHALVAEGAVDIAIEPHGLHVWDLAALRVIVEEAGGRLTDLSGAARADGGSGVSTNGLLHDAVLAAING